MKGAVWYAGAVVAVVVAGGFLLIRLFPGEEDAAAVWLSGAIVAVVQVAGFVGLRMAGRVEGQVMMAWGGVALLRLLTMLVYAVLVATVIAVPLAPALIGMAVFFFVSTVIEPLFLRV